jgi:hypothetical protein
MSVMVVVIGVTGLFITGDIVVTSTAVVAPCAATSRGVEHMGPEEPEPVAYRLDLVEHRVSRALAGSSP